MWVLIKTNKNLSTQLLWKDVVNFCVCSIVQGCCKGSQEYLLEDQLVILLLSLVFVLAECHADLHVIQFNTLYTIGVFFFVTE